MTNTLALVIAALIAVESGGNDHATGDGGRAVGCLQIWPITVQEANRLAGATRFTLADRRTRAGSIAIARVILAHHWRRGHRDPVSLACRWRNPYSPCPAWYRRKCAAAINQQEQHTP